MRIGYFVGSFPYMSLVNDINYYRQYHHGGAEIVAYHLAIAMAKRKHEINVFTTSIDSRDSFERSSGVNIYRYGTNFRIASGNISFKLIQKPLKHELDIVHAHSPIPPSDITALRYVKKKTVPFVLTYHGDGQEDIGGFIRNTSVSFYNKYILAKVLSRADVIISPSKYYVNESRFLWKYQDKIVVIPNGIRIEDFDVPYTKEECRKKIGLPLDKTIILFVGNLTPYKGPDVLVRAMPTIMKEVPDTKLIIAGNGKMRSRLEGLTNKLGIGKYIEFVGFVKETSKLLYYRAADVFCLPSTMSTEVFPIVLLEASASGLPIVVSDLDTFKCIIEDEYNGLFTRRADEKSLANGIIYLLENEEIRNKMSRNARKKVKDYSWEGIAEATERVYNNATNARAIVGKKLR
jgi:glycosyltransferase involved in cell wall biosynthesis